MATNADATTGAATDEATDFGNASLAEFGDSWKRPGDFADSARLVDVQFEDCEKTIRREQYVLETRDHVQVPPSRYDELADTRIPFEQRLDSAREEFLDATIDYVTEPLDIETCGPCEGVGDVECTNCTNGEHRCGTCVGSGMESCSNCSRWGAKGGKGRITCPDCNGDGSREVDGTARTCSTCNGSGHVMCNSCSGQGEHRCTNCGGGGLVTCGTCNGATRVTCGTCNGEQELVSAEIGTLEFESTESVNGHSSIGIPSGMITKAGGEFIRSDEDWQGIDALDEQVLLRTEIERRSIGASAIDYEYGDEGYRLFDIEGRLQAESYPQSRSRSVIPYLLGVGLVAAIGVLLYLYAI